MSSTFPQLLPRRQSRAGAIVLEGQIRFTLPRSKTPLSDLFPTLSRVRGVSVWSQLSPNRCRDKGAEKAGSLYIVSGDHAKLSPKVTQRACGPPTLIHTGQVVEKRETPSHKQSSLISGSRPHPDLMGARGGELYLRPHRGPKASHRPEPCLGITFTFVSH